MNIDSSKVKIYEVLSHMFARLLLMAVAVLMLLVLLGFFLYFLINGKTQEALITGGADLSLFGLTIWKVYSYYFFKKEPANRKSSPAKP